MRRSSFLILAAIAACSASPAPITTRGHAIDGDTVSIPVRLHGVDAFESRQMCADAQHRCWPCGHGAQNYTAHFIADRTIDVTLDPGSTHDRSVGTITAGGDDLGLALILAGYAIPLPDFLRNDPQRAQVYTRAFEQAQRNRRGAFAGEWLTPQQWRQGRRLACERTP